MSDFKFFKIRSPSEKWVEGLENNCIEVVSLGSPKKSHLLPSCLANGEFLAIIEGDEYHTVISSSSGRFTSWWQRNPKNYRNPYAIYNASPRIGKPSYLGFNTATQKLTSSWNILQKGAIVRIRPEIVKEHYDMSLSTKIYESFYYETWLIEGGSIMNFLKKDKCTEILKNYGEDFNQEDVEITPFPSYESMLEY